MINEFIITSPKQEHSASDTASPETIHDSGQIRTKDPFRSSGVQKLSWRGFKATACCNKHLETRVIAMRITPDLIKWIKVHAQRRADFSISGVTELLLFSYAICVAAVFIKPNCIIWLISHKKTAATGVTPIPESLSGWQFPRLVFLDVVVVYRCHLISILICKAWAGRVISVNI